MNVTEERAHELIVQRAAEWFVANRGGALSGEERAAFVAWLKTSPEHVREYLAVASLSREVGAVAREDEVDVRALLAAGGAEAEAVPNVVTLPGSSADAAIVARAAAPPGAARTRWSYAVAAAFALVAVAAGSLWALRDGEWLGLPRAYQTAHGEQTTWRLPDGSVVHLNTDSRVMVRFSDAERRVEVDKGQAHFRVAREAARRFRVSAGEVAIVAVGTEFDVYRRDDSTLVTVVEGKVAVTSMVGTPGEVQLAAGQQVSVHARTWRASPAAKVSRVAPVQADLRASTAWLQRQIVFEQRQLAEVAREFNRYGRVPIEIEGEDLAALRISGVFNAYDTESFVAFLGRLEGVAVESDPKRIRVRSRPLSQDAGSLTVGQ